MKFDYRKLVENNKFNEQVEQATTLPANCQVLSRGPWLLHSKYLNVMLLNCQEKGKYLKSTNSTRTIQSIPCIGQIPITLVYGQNAFEIKIVLFLDY